MRHEPMWFSAIVRQRAAWLFTPCYLADGDLSPGYTGVRPKIVPAGAPDADFVIQGPAVHGVPSLVNLFGIESPGLTASLALADEVRLLLDL